MDFKGFKYGTNRFSIRGLLAAISRLFKKTPSDAQGVFTLGVSKNDVGTWQIIILNNDISSRCQLDRMVYCKCTGDKEHEFLLLHFRHPIQQHAVSILVIDRVPLRTDHTQNNNGSSKQLRQSSSIVSPPVYPSSTYDSVFTTPSKGAIQSYLHNTYGPYKKLIDLEFSASARPSAIQVTMLLSALNKHSPLYDLYQHQCYWYAHTVWEALKKLFPDWRETTRCQGRSRYLGLKIEKAHSVEVVCEQYHILWARIVNAPEERRKAKEDEARQLRMEGWAQGQAEIEQALAEAARYAEEVARQKEEVARQKEEVARQREEVMRQTEEVTRQTEEAMRKADENTQRVRFFPDFRVITLFTHRFLQVIGYQAEIDQMRARIAQFERQAA
ncbi:hypothetical protein DEU56DRAFT_895932 [Suillus clintonianus]|uniref:uncharacterized protein n=1 Tax=Suillus clintonianus TaxID=1904413 RepID=UPI001B87E153|nr:uncharacterized protein DEU56DRAFT_895932 [Suillus clintonianus]KAG2115623.1 hypothetical protein DEU56DRAFT_895932 [Suillus clintonianus]